VNTLPRASSIKLSRFHSLIYRIRAILRQFAISWRVFVNNKLAVIGVGLLVTFLMMLVAYPLLIKFVWSNRIYNPITGCDSRITNPAPPSIDHIFGTDAMGHDNLSMLLFATRHTFLVGCFAALVAFLTGTLMGAVSGYYDRKWLGVILVNISSGLLLLPAPLFMILLSLSFNIISPYLFGAIYGILVGLSNMGMVLRSLAISLLPKPFIESARVSGGRDFHIIYKHIIPHLLPMASLYMMFTVCSAVIADGFVSFFGTTSTSVLSWGQMIYNGFTMGRIFALGPQWWTLIPPAICLSLFSASFYLISLGLHQVVNPSLRPV
jgi:peptide/nickel transport system permease protein